MAEATLPVTLATFLFLVRRGGVRLLDPAIGAACAAFDPPPPGEKATPPDQLGAALVHAVEAALASAAATGDHAPADMLRIVLGDDHVFTDLGEGADRLARAGAIRRAHFGQQLPWLARIVDRAPDGELLRHWVLVEGFDEVARVMDPNPWDDRDEERQIPVNDFLVQWELAGCGSVRVG